MAPYFAIAHDCVLEQNGVASGLPCRCRRGADRRRQSRRRESAAIGPRGLVTLEREEGEPHKAQSQVRKQFQRGQLANGKGLSV